MLFILAFTFVGLVMRGPYLALLLAVGSVAGYSWEDLTWRNARTHRFPRIDRPVLAVIGVVLVGATAFFAWSDRQHDYKYYQYTFRNMVAEKLGADRAATVPSGLQQIWVAGPAPRRSLRDLPPGGVAGRGSRQPRNRTAPILSSPASRIPRSASGAARATAARAGPSTPPPPTARWPTGRNRCSASPWARRTRSSTTRRR